MTTGPKEIKLFFLGTGAADWPVPYSPAVDKAQHGAVRGFSSVLVDGQVLIDCGTTVPDVIHHFGVNPKDILDILVTHTHTDHFDVDAFKHLISQRNDTPPVNLWAHSSLRNFLPEIPGVCIRSIEVEETAKLSTMTVTALAANHDMGKETPLHYLLQKPSVAVLYATDCAWFLKNTWEWLRKTVLDAVIWDATCGETQGDERIFVHNSMEMIRIMRETFLKNGVLSPHAQNILTHMSREMCAPHDVMTKRLVPQGFLPAYDGLSLSIAGTSDGDKDPSERNAK